MTIEMVNLVLIIKGEKGKKIPFQSNNNRYDIRRTANAVAKINRINLKNVDHEIKYT